MTFHPPYLTSQPLYLCHHTDGTDICIDVLLYWWHHNKCVSHHTWHTCDNIPNLNLKTFTVYDINDHVFGHHKHSMHDIRSPLYDIHPLFRTSQHFMYDIKATVSDLTSIVSVSSHPPYWWHHSHYMDGISSNISVTSYPLNIWHNIHEVWHHNTLCWWHHTLHMCDILCTVDDIAYTLSHKTRVFMIPHSLQAWLHTRSIRHFTHCMFVITTSPLISHPLLNDITPRFHVTSYALYRTSRPILMSSQSCTYDVTASIYETTSSM